MGADGAWYGGLPVHRIIGRTISQPDSAAQPVPRARPRLSGAERRLRESSVQGTRHADGLVFQEFAEGNRGCVYLGLLGLGRGRQVRSKRHGGHEPRAYRRGIRRRGLPAGRGLYAGGHAQVCADAYGSDVERVARKSEDRRPRGRAGRRRNDNPGLDRTVPVGSTNLGYLLGAVQPPRRTRAGDSAHPPHQGSARRPPRAQVVGLQRRQTGGLPGLSCICAKLRFDVGLRFVRRKVRSGR